MRILKQLYDGLDFVGGDLLPATDRPCKKRADWLEKGEWLAAGKRAKVDRLFFVKNNPVAVFSSFDGSELERVRAFNRAWCLARPRLLFLAAPGQLTVYDLNQPPVDEADESEWRRLRHLDILTDVADVADRLQRFHRDHIESGALFAEERFGNLKDRADKALIRDLKTVRSQLIGAGLSGSNARFAHALIGRSIFIRYLEDRGVLEEKDFRDVAGTKAGWTKLLTEPADRQGLDLSNTPSLYARVLADKDFTYALFRRLARDFNGDMFPDVEEEEGVVTQQHLNLLQDLLYGEVGTQKQLFFYSYRFDIVPLDLISSIYEEFYHASTVPNEKRSKARQDGAYYTPPVLVEFLLSRVLTESELKKSPRVFDPACGSGIFLVEAFRRIVRYHWHRKKQPPTFDDLREILRCQIAGIEANPEAARVAAFSLYLSMLHYLDPPAINGQIKKGNKLPNLVASTSTSPNYFHCIFPGNAFDLDSIESRAAWRDAFGSNCADVVVGNPPWGAPGKNADASTKERHQVTLSWCGHNSRPISGKEPSQAFLWRALHLLKPNGKAAMLLPAGILFKHSTKAQTFRLQWMQQVELTEVFNFSHVRKHFFKEGNSPFLAMTFRNSSSRAGPVDHWVARQTSMVRNTQTVNFTRYDHTVLVDQPLLDHSLWKTLYVGRMCDRELMGVLSRQTRLLSYVDRPSSGQGFKVASQESPADVLAKYPRLDLDSFSRYDTLRFVDPPTRVHRLGVISVYSGSRILLKRGISERGSSKGQVVARYETKPFCFTHAIDGIKLNLSDEWAHKALLGILWSSLARYVFLMTSSTWGLWHHEIHLDDELLGLPVVLDPQHPATKRVIGIVDQLRGYQPVLRSLRSPDGQTEKQIAARRRSWQKQLDDAVFDLYCLNEEQRDLVRDCCDVTLPLMYSPFDSIGASHALDGDATEWLETYIRLFCRRWKPYLADGEDMRAEVHVGAHGNMIAVEFYPADAEDPWDMKPKEDWSYVLDQIADALPTPMGTSGILLDGVVHATSEHGIFIIKRNVKHLWTRSLAREDADSALAKHMQKAALLQGDVG